MAKRRYITNPHLDNLGAVALTSRVLVINVNGEVANSGYTIADISSGIPLESDNVNDSDPNVNKFVSQTELDKLNNISVTDPVDLNYLQDQLFEIAMEDLADYFLNKITF